MTLWASRVAATELPRILPGLLESLSIARGQIVLDQLQSAVRNHGQAEIVLVTLSEAESSVPLAAAIAIHDKSNARLDAGQGHAAGNLVRGEIDSASLLHAGPCPQQSRDFHPGDLAALSETLDRALAQRGVRFVQWATDVPGRDSDPKWCRGLGFCPVAQLNYLSGSIADTKRSDIATTDATTDAEQLNLVPVDWANGEVSVREFSSILQETYLETLDCPRLTEFRTAAQSIAAYCRSASFAPHLWYKLQDGDCGDFGCLILAQHGSVSQQTAVASDSQSRRIEMSGVLVVELVYMGLMPSARGCGRGRKLLGKAIEIAADQGANRLILAVDESNVPARVIYERAGLRPVMRESVWVKSLKP